MPRRSEIQDVVQDFVERLSSLIEEDAISRARDVVLSAFGGRAPAGLRLRGPGRPVALGGTNGRRKRRDARKNRRGEESNRGKLPAGPNPRRWSAWKNPCAKR